MSPGLYTSARYKIDGKGRVFIPAKQRYLFGEEAILTVWPGPSLLLMPVENWKEWEKRFFSGIDFLERNPEETSKEMQRKIKFRRALYGHMTQPTLDKSGRIVIPQNLQEYGKLKDEVQFVGYGNYYELWNPDNWEQIMTKDILDEFSDADFNI